jgi:hypothetical protein
MTSQIKSYSIINKLTDSTVKMSRRLTADVDAWAEAHDTVRSDAIRQLIEFGLSSTSSVDPLGAARRDSVEIEDLAVEQIGQLLDPSLPIAERERRIRRLTAGPPEFSDERIDLPLREWADRAYNYAINDRRAWPSGQRSRRAHLDEPDIPRDEQNWSRSFLLGNGNVTLTNSLGSGEAQNDTDSVTRWGATN